MKHCTSLFFFLLLFRRDMPCHIHVAEFLQSIFGDIKVILEILPVAQRQPLAEDGNLADIAEIDDVTLSHPCKYGGRLLETLVQDALHPGQIHADGNLHLVVQDYVRVIAVRLEIDDFGNVNSEELVTGVQVKVFCFVHLFLMFKV